MSGFSLLYSPPPAENLLIPHQTKVTPVDSRTPDFYSPNEWLILPPPNTNIQVIVQ